MERLTLEQKMLWRIREILEDSDTCSLCPMRRQKKSWLVVRRFYRFWLSGEIHLKTLTWEPHSPVKRYCTLCRKSVGLPEKYSYGVSPKCPCKALGPEAAKRRAWLTIEEKLQSLEGENYG